MAKSNSDARRSAQSMPSGTPARRTPTTGQTGSVPRSPQARSEYAKAHAPSQQRPAPQDVRRQPAAEHTPRPRTATSARRAPTSAAAPRPRSSQEAQARRSNASAAAHRTGVGSTPARPGTQPRGASYPQRGTGNPPRRNSSTAQQDSRRRTTQSARPAAPRRDGYSAYDAERAERARRARAARAEYERRRAAELEQLRRLEREIKKVKREHRRATRRIFLGRAAVTGIIFLLLATLLCGSLALNFKHTPDSSPSSISYIFGGDTNYVRSVSSAVALRGGRLYISFNDIAEYLDLFVVGDAEGMRFIFPSSEHDPLESEDSGGEDEVTFKDKSRTATVNSRETRLDGESFMLGEEIWVCASFVDEYLSPLDISREGDTVRISRLENAELSTKNETVYYDVSLTLKSEQRLSSLSDPSAPSGGSTLREEVTFKSDLSAYEKYMAPEDKSEYLTLVNSSSPLDASYAPSDLVGVTATRNDGRETQMLRECAAYALEALFTELAAEGFTDVSVTSGYRSYESQLALHEQYIADEMARDATLDREAAEALVLTYSSAPGTSEHQTGLCVDMHSLLSADISYAETDSYKWLAENAWKFGFVLRYPENKTDITGITFEPWHWRFVGRENARAMRDGAVCLEEYALTVGNENE